MPLLDKLQLRAEEKQPGEIIALGWKQKLVFAAILHEPKIVFLDEPTGGVDPVTCRCEVLGTSSTKRPEKDHVFVTTHYMDEAEYCNRISIMVDGRSKIRTRCTT